MLLSAFIKCHKRKYNLIEDQRNKKMAGKSQPFNQQSIYQDINFLRFSFGLIMFFNTIWDVRDRTTMERRDEQQESQGNDRLSKDHTTSLPGSEVGDIWEFMVTKTFQFPGNEYFNESFSVFA